VIKKYLCLLVISGNIIFSGEIFAAKPAGDFGYDLGFLMALYLAVDFTVEECIEKHPVLTGSLKEGVNLWKNKNLKGIKRLNQTWTDYVYKKSKNEVAFERNSSKIKQKLKSGLILNFRKINSKKFEAYCRFFPMYIMSKKGDLFLSQKDRLENVFDKDSNFFTSEPKNSNREDRFSSEKPKKPEPKDYIKKLADAKEYGKYSHSVISFTNRFASIVSEVSEIQDLCDGMMNEEVSIDYANRRVKIIIGQVELELLELKKSVKDIYEPNLTSSLKDSVAILNVYISNLPKDARNIIDNYYGLFKATKEGDGAAIFKISRQVRLNGLKLFENTNAIISLEKNKINENAPIFHYYDSILNINRSYMALIKARISESDNPVESQLDFLAGDVALHIKQAEKYLRASKKSVANGYAQMDSLTNKFDHLSSARKYLSIWRKVETIFRDALSGEEKLIAGMDIILADFPGDEYIDDFTTLMDKTAYKRQSYFKKIFPLVSEFNSQFNADIR
jgi:hypothetical protein